MTVNVSTSPTLTLPESSLSALWVSCLTTVIAGLFAGNGATGVFSELLVNWVIWPAVAVPVLSIEPLRASAAVTV